MTKDVNNPTPPSQEELRIGFGTLQAYQALEKKIMSISRPDQIILAINIATLLRNNISTVAYVDGQKFIDKTAKPSLNVHGVVDKTKTVMADIANGIGQICNAKFKGYKHHILFYLTDPLKQVPKEWTRSQDSEAAVKLATVTAAFMREVKPFDQENGDTFLHVRMAPFMKVPSYVGISEVLKEFANYHIPIHMISHMPIDYHTPKYGGRSGTLYRSHTGAVVPMTPAELGKSVFKEDEIPFYPSTHILFGDKYLIKGCLGRKEKNMIVAAAKQNHWGVRTSDYIVSKIKDYGIQLPYKLP